MKNNKIKVYIFIFIILIFVFGGFYLMKQSEKIITPIKVVENKNNDIRIDTTKEYVYFTDVNVVEGELDIEYKTINLNFANDDGVQTLLNNDNEQMSKSVTYDENNDEATYNHLVSALFAKYDVIYFADYISIVENKYSFDYKNIITTLGSNVYVFDKKNGKLINDNELLSAYNLTKDDVKNKINTYFEDKNLLEEENKVDITSTMDNYTNYNLYVDNLGRLVTTVLAKAEKSDYNEIIVLS